MAVYYRLRRDVIHRDCRKAISFFVFISRLLTNSVKIWSNLSELSVS